MKNWEPLVSGPAWLPVDMKLINHVRPGECIRMVQKKKDVSPLKSNPVPSDKTHSPCWAIHLYCGTRQTSILRQGSYLCTRSLPNTTSVQLHLQEAVLAKVQDVWVTSEPDTTLAQWTGRKPNLSQVLLVCKTFTVDGHPTCTIAVGGVATLYHEAGDDAWPIDARRRLFHRWTHIQGTVKWWTFVAIRRTLVAPGIYAERQNMVLLFGCPFLSKLALKIGHVKCQETYKGPRSLQRSLAHALLTKKLAFGSANHFFTLKTAAGAP